MSNTPNYGPGNAGPGSPGLGGFGTPPGGPRPAPNMPGPMGPGGGGRVKPERPVTRRVVNTQKIFALVLAIVVAGLAIVLVGGDGAQLYVVRAKIAIPALAEVDRGQMEAVVTPETMVQPGAFTGESAEKALAAAEKALGKQPYTQMAIVKGAQIVPDYFNRERELVEPLKPGERLVSLPASVAYAVAGQIKAGDRVDVIAVMQSEQGKLANVIAQDLEVVSVVGSQQQFEALSQRQAAGQNEDASALPENPVPGIYVMRAESQVAVALAAALVQGEIVIVWRGQDAKNTETAAVDLAAAISTNAGPLVSGQ